MAILWQNLNFFEQLIILQRIRAYNPKHLWCIRWIVKISKLKKTTKGAYEPAHKNIIWFPVNNRPTYDDE